MLINLLMSLEIQPDLSSLLLTSANKQRTFITSRVLFGVFFPKMLECFGCALYTSAAYTRVFTVLSTTH